MNSGDTDIPRQRDPTASIETPQKITGVGYLRQLEERWICKKCDVGIGDNMSCPATIDLQDILVLVHSSLEQASRPENAK